MLSVTDMFAFANAGLSLTGVSLADLVHPVTLGIIAGLVIGKPLGILLLVGTAVRLRVISLPDDVNWGQVLGVSFACGIGFTMSLFIAGLAFEHGSGAYFSGDRLGILVGSMISALAAFAILHAALPRADAADAAAAKSHAET